MLYDYECSNCKHFMEDVYQSIKDEALTKCPKCKKKSLERIIYGGSHFSVKKSCNNQQTDGCFKTTYRQGNKKKLQQKHFNVVVNNSLKNEMNNVDPKDRKKWAEKRANQDFCEKVYVKETTKKRKD